MRDNAKAFWVFLGVGLFLLLGVLYLLYRQDSAQDVTSFDQCVRAGNPVMESYPRQCRTAQGELFVEPISVTSTPTTTSPTSTSTSTSTSSSMIQVTSPTPNQVIGSPVTVSGQAVGNWYFEASFPLKIVDANGVILAQVPVQAQGNWMTTNFVPFAISVTFSTPTAPTGFMIFQKDNPSGLPQNDAELQVPVQFTTSSSGPSTSVEVYFHNPLLLASGQDDCTTVFPVERKVFFSEAVGRMALQELLKGPTTQEQSAGYATNLNTGVTIQSLKIENGVARVDFSATLDQGVAGSCRVMAIRSQIEETLKQFPTVQSVVISINGNTEDILQP